MNEIVFKYANHYEARVTGNVRLESREVIHSEIIDNGKYEAFIKSTNIEGIYFYGLKQLTEHWYDEHGIGYIWASRAGVMNRIFGTELLECVYDNTCCAIDRRVLDEIIDHDKYVVDPHPRASGEDVEYHIICK